MSKRRKKKPHKCKNHPKVTARGRCVKCGSWICRDCAYFENGRFFCADTCFPKQAMPVDNTEQAMPVSSKETKKMSYRWLVVLAGATFGLCSLFFGIWMINENRILRHTINVLKENRMELIGLIKEKNARIDSLTNDTTHSLSGGEAFNNGKTCPVRPVRIGSGLYGLPLSFENGAPDKKLVSLTFDGGSHCNVARDILDTLKSRRVLATMFLTGQFVRRFPDITRRISEEGHDVGNHTYSHPHLTSWAEHRRHLTMQSVDEGFICEELRKADAAYRKLTGNGFLPIWRAPYGEKNGTICSWAQKCGFLHVGWKQASTWLRNLDSNDWVPDDETPGYHSPSEVIEKILSLAESHPNGINGGIILFHLGTVRKDPGQQIHSVLGELIDRLRGMGYRIVPVTEMLRESGVDISVLRINAKS